MYINACDDRSAATAKCGSPGQDRDSRAADEEVATSNVQVKCCMHDVAHNVTTHTLQNSKRVVGL